MLRIRIFTIASVPATLAVAVLVAFTFFGGAAAKAGGSPNSRPAVASHATGASVASKTFTQTLTFSDAFDTHTFTIQVAKGGKSFTASTLDCCIAGDHWGVFVMRYGGTPTGVSNPNASNCGTGSTTAYSGAATLSGTYLSGKSVQVIVTHCSGVSDFPADLTLMLSSNANITVTERT